ncbi:DUF4893 domain-containing protein [Loktanella sp. M215]|uniref:DUF4893 domain-containing protein n=1 Tax=Loktanella sp. M215 TaxID=2675431 RepID=UPI001F358DA1|nr:DUF4893 domain-containing protein [Loktanella sp. M215]MCF7699627.1 DUF4893 domain-containing protein [Loktanella sp. M215]
MIRAACIAILCLPGMAVAQQDDLGLHPADQARLDGFDATVGKALLQAFAGGRLGDVDQLQEVLSGQPVAPLETTLQGNWTCRMLKVGGDLNPLVVYAPFDCEIAADGTGFTVEKVSGSQRLTGRIALLDGQMVLTGTGYVTDTTPVAYADLPQDTTGDGTLWPVVGVAEQVAQDRIRILMPKPVLESDLDILDLRRKPAPEAPAPAPVDDTETPAPAND